MHLHTELNSSSSWCLLSATVWLGSYSLVLRLFVILDVHVVYHRFMPLQGPNCFLFWGFFWLTISPWKATVYVVSLYSVVPNVQMFLHFLSNSSFCNSILCSQVCVEAMHSSVIDWARKRTKVCIQLSCWPAGWSRERLFTFISSALRKTNTLLKIRGVGPPKV